MPIPNRPRAPTVTPGLQLMQTDDGSFTLWNEKLGETYHSACGAAAESLVVYLLNSGVFERLSEGRPTAVLEVGFGTAMDFLLTTAVAEHFGASLRFVGLDNDLLDFQLLRDMHRENLAKRSRDYCVAHQVPVPESVFGRIDAILEETLAIGQCSLADGDVHSIGRHTQIRLRIGDASDYLTMPISDEQRFHAVYFDPFSPENAAELWRPEVLGGAFERLEPGGTLTTYCVKSSIRRALQDVGFTVRRLPGPVGGKREVLWATRGKNESEP